MPSRGRTMQMFTGVLRKAAAVILLLVSHQAHAEGTAANTQITNTATVNYQIGGIDQPAVTSQIQFVVDRKVTLTVAEVGGTATIVTPGGTNQVSTFTLTNTSNATLDFGLAVAQLNGGAAAFGGTDSIDAANVRIFVESGATPGFQATEDTQTGFVDEVEASTGPTNGIRTIYVVADIPVTAVNNDIAGITLTAQAREAGTATVQGAIVAQTAGADTPSVMDTVFGDSGGAAIGDTTRDGRHSDDDSFNVAVTALQLVKTSTLISDPFNGTTNPKAVPGAEIEYCVQLENPGAQPASNVTVTDVLPTQMSFVSGTIRSNVTVNGSNICQSGSGDAEDDDAIGGDEADPNGGSYNAATRAVSAVAGMIAANAKTAIRFRVTIN